MGRPDAEDGVLRTIAQSDGLKGGTPALMKDGIAHEMPVWGTLFRIMWKDEPPMVRCGSLAKYLESIQTK